MVADLAEFPYGNMGMGKEMVPNFDSAIDDDMRKERAVPANLDVSFDGYIGTDGGSVSDLCRRINHRGGMDSRLVLYRSMKQGYGASISELRIFDAKQRLINRGKLLIHNNG